MDKIDNDQAATDLAIDYVMAAFPVVEEAGGIRFAFQKRYA